MPATSEPRFETYEVFHRHTNKVIDTYPTRSAAETAAGKDHAYRVRGGRPVKPKGGRTRMGDVLRSLARLNRGE